MDREGRGQGVDREGCGWGGAWTGRGVDGEGCGRGGRGQGMDCQVPSCPI